MGNPTYVKAIHITAQHFFIEACDSNQHTPTSIMWCQFRTPTNAPHRGALWELMRAKKHAQLNMWGWFGPLALLRDCYLIWGTFTRSSLLFLYLKIRTIENKNFWGTFGIPWQAYVHLRPKISFRGKKKAQKILSVLCN